METSKQIAEIGRIVHVWIAGRDRPIPAIVTTEGHIANGGQFIDCNIFAHGDRERDLIAWRRQTMTGDTIESVELYDALTPEQRAEVLDEPGLVMLTSVDNETPERVIAEWPPRV